MNDKTRGALASGLALLTNGFGDYAEAVLADVRDEAVQPVLALVRQGATPAAMAQIREMLRDDR